MRTQPARRPRAASVLSLALAVSLFVGLVASGASPLGVARAQRSAIDTYAITGARIVPVSGAEIARGTVV
ncbi:MAG TPA: hypothetical protein VIQ24_12170, partial [Pyrinomonadaceae bacterium]